MSDFDVSFRLRLVNQLSRPAEKADRDLKQLADTARRLGQTRGGQGLSDGLEKVGREAGQAKGKLNALETEADQLRRAIGRVDDNAFTALKGKARAAKSSFDTIETEAKQLRRAIGRVDDNAFTALKGKTHAAKTAFDTVETEARQLRRAIGRIDDGAFDGLKADAHVAEQSIRDIGKAADETRRKIGRIDDRAPGRSGRYLGTGPHPPASHLGGGRRAAVRSGIGAAYERSGLDAYVPLSGGAAVAVGAGTAATVVGGALAYKKYAGRDRQIGYIAENAGANVKETEAGKERIRDTANELSAPIDMAIEAMAQLAATGLTWKQSLDRLAIVLKTSIATNASPSDIASTVFNIGDKMKVANKDMPTALDYVAGGGDQGQFETNDMARYLPNLLAQGRTAGYTGLKGLRRIIAMAQIVRGDTGDSASAATNLDNILFKYNSPETIKNFDAYGIDLRKQLAAGKTRGEDPIVTLRNLTEKATGGDDTKVNTLFRDAQVYKAMISLSNAIESGSLDRMEKRISGSEGTVERKHERFSNDAQASLDRLGNAWDNFIQKSGRALENMGVKSLLTGLGGAMNVVGTDTREQGAKSTFGYLKDILLPRDYSNHPALAKPDPAPANKSSAATKTLPVPTPRPAFAVPVPTPRPDGGAAGTKSMNDYNDALKKGGDEAAAEAMSIADRIRAALGFTVHPTIAPTYRDPGKPAPSTGARPKAGSNKQSSLTPETGGSVKLTQHITSPNPHTAARKAQREQNRSIRHAQARALSDLGTKWA